MITFTIEVPNEDGNIGVRTVARDVSPQEAKPLLRRAIAALEAELEALDECPWHKAAIMPRACQGGATITACEADGTALAECVACGMFVRADQVEHVTLGFRARYGG